MEKNNFPLVCINCLNYPTLRINPQLNTINIECPNCSFSNNLTIPQYIHELRKKEPSFKWNNHCKDHDCPYDRYCTFCYCHICSKDDSHNKHNVIKLGENKEKVNQRAGIIKEGYKYILEELSVIKNSYIKELVDKINQIEASYEKCQLKYFGILNLLEMLFKSYNEDAPNYYVEQNILENTNFTINHFEPKTDNLIEKIDKLKLYFDLEVFQKKLLNINSIVSNLQTKNIELILKKRQAEYYSKTIRQHNFNKKTTKNQSPMKTINNSISSNNNESSQLTRSVQGKPRLSLIKTTNITNKGSTHKTNQIAKNKNIKKSNTMQENNPQRKIINNAIINTHINHDSKKIQTPKGIEKGNKSFNTEATPKKQQNNNPLSRKSSKKILEGNKKKDIKIDETNNIDGKTQETLLNEEKKLQNVGSMVDAKKPETSITESKQGDLSNEIEIENSYTYCNSHSL